MPIDRHALNATHAVPKGTVWLPILHSTTRPWLQVNSARGDLSELSAAVRSWSDAVASGMLGWEERGLLAQLRLAADRLGAQHAARLAAVEEQEHSLR